MRHATSTRRHDVAHQELALEPHRVTSSPRALVAVAAALVAVRAAGSGGDLGAPALAGCSGAADVDDVAESIRVLA